MASGIFHRRAAGSSTSSAIPPQPVLASTRSPGLTLVTPSPTALTTAEGWARGANGRSGLNWYLSSIISTSGKLTPIALTEITAWPGLASGEGTSSSTRVSGPPTALLNNAFMSALPVVFLRSRDASPAERMFEERRGFGLCPRVPYIRRSPKGFPPLGRDPRHFSCAKRAARDREAEPFRADADRARGGADRGRGRASGEGPQAGEPALALDPPLRRHRLLADERCRRGDAREPRRGP